jgi:xylan 1,4-beta-xylosidase
VQYATEGDAKDFVLVFQGEHVRLKGQITRVDENSGNPQHTYEQMGSPAYPTVQQIDELKKQSEIARPEVATLNTRGELAVRIPPNGVVLVELR